MAMIVEISKNEVITLVQQTLDLPLTNEINNTFLANCIRRTAGFKCPCSATTLVNEVKKALKFIIENDEASSSNISEMIDLLIVNGDLLELSDVTTSEQTAKGTWIFAAPLSFVIRSNGLALIIGITADGSLPIGSLTERVTFESFRRYISPEEGEHLTEKLIDFGLTQISESTWLKLPRKISSKDLLHQFNRALENAPNSGSILDLQILDSRKSPHNYKRRWTPVANETGNYICRRPQKFGAAQWCYASFDNGQLTKFIDIPTRFNSVAQRQCDVSWLIQLAVDHENNTPQQYSVRSNNRGPVIDFYSPIPLWAERKLIAIGTAAEPINCLFSYNISSQELLIEENFLSEYLWLTKKVQNL